MQSSELDFSASYAVDGYRGIAFWIEPRMIRDEDYEWTGIEEQDPDYVHAVMVGDDRRHVIDVSDLTVISDEDYCHGCGQIGCGH